jgi:hypothetical protein
LYEVENESSSLSDDLMADLYECRHLVMRDSQSIESNVDRFVVLMNMRRYSTDRERTLRIMKWCYPEDDDRCLNDRIATLESQISKGKTLMLPSLQQKC